MIIRAEVININYGMSQIGRATGLWVGVGFLIPGLFSMVYGLAFVQVPGINLS